MSKKKKSLVIMAIIVLSFSIVYPTFANDTPQYEQESLKILDKQPRPCWWLDGYRQEKTDKSYQEAGLKLLNSYNDKTSDIVREHLGKIYVNPYNNTVFVVLKDSSDDVRSNISTIMEPSKNVKVIFRDCSYSKEELENWFNLILDYYPELEKNGVYPQSLTFSANGTLVMGVEKVNALTIDTIKAILGELLPLDALVIYPENAVVLTSQHTPNRPVVAGLNTTSFSRHLNDYDWATSGFHVTWNGGSDTGILIAGHMASTTTTDVDQPDGYKIGDVLTISDMTDTDAALVEYDNGIEGIHNIYSSGIFCNVTDVIEYVDVLDGDDVEMMGATSGLETCEVVNKGAKTHPLYGNLNLQIMIDYVSLGGDSGAPVYAKWYESGPGIYTATAYGTQWGNNGVVSYVNSITGLQGDFNENLDFTQ